MYNTKFYLHFYVLQFLMTVVIIFMKQSERRPMGMWGTNEFRMGMMKLASK